MKAWEDFVTQLKQDFDPSAIDAWIKPLKIVRFDAANLYLEANDSFQINWFDEHIRPRLKGRFFNNNGRAVKVHLRLAGSAAKTKVKADESTFEIRSDCLDSDLTFTTFIPTTDNLIASKLLTEVSTGALPEATFNPIFLFGPSGSGKTHLLMAAAHGLFSSKRIFYIRAEAFTEHVVQAIRLGRMQEFRQAYRQIDVLIMDDIHIFSRKWATQEEFFHTFNTLHTMGKQIILSASCAPSQLKEIEPRLVSRFEWGIALELKKPGCLREILQLKATKWGLSLTAEVFEFLMQEIPSRSIDALHALALRFDGVKIDRFTAERILSDFQKEEREKKPTPELLIKGVAAHFGIKGEDLLGKSQTREFAYPRQIAMYACREKLKMPFQKIGELFQRDHSTVMSSVKQIQKGIEDKKRDLLEAMRSLPL